MVSVPSIPDKLLELTQLGHTKEYILDYLVRNYDVLLHGSRVDIRDNYIRPNRKGEVFATNLACIAILKAIFSNIGLERPHGLQYPYHISEKNPLVLRIHGINNNTIGNNGFVYIITEKSGFKNTRAGSWEYVKYHENIPFSYKLEIVRNDFNYPVFDVTNNKWIQ